MFSNPAGCFRIPAFNYTKPTSYKVGILFSKQLFKFIRQCQVYGTLIYKILFDD
jgi:hypothetical protein